GRARGAARAPRRRDLDRRGSRLPRNPLRTPAGRAHDLDRQRRQRGGAVDVGAHGERDRRPVPHAVAAPGEWAGALPGGRAVIFVTVGTQLPFDRLIMAVDEWAGAAPGRRVFA